ncbi:ABC transporter permease [Herbiconiux sp. CPCC 203407]|uniref:ABC transporter permease n=1 Tax=Herbiconiux oxytropis TaxID=2970915 RepID=A0AA41XGK9_9MICO|nr:ABC transporter permease [Herbiconiux oxytropis]MCS5722875.1 ABC transporter permease [Herbiconiux oxytropis]MCS5725865.1 ABC transporter permease [Herbiconiux oxytropis]
MVSVGPIGVNRRLPRSRTPRASRGFGEGMIWTGAALVGLVVLASVFAPLLTPWGPIEIDSTAIRQAPGPDHWLGTDANGMDVFSRLLHAGRVDLGVAVVSVAVAVVIGSLIGAVSGYVGGALDAIVMRLLEILQAFPTFILALAVAALLGPGIVNLTIVVAIVSVPSYARLVRAEVRTVRELAYVDAARTSGLVSARVLLRHVIPNSLAPVRIVAPLNVGWAMLALAGLSFLGLGVPVPQPEWGAMISQGTSDIVAGRLWTSVPPGLALVVCVLGFSLLGEGLQERETRRRTR